VLRAAARQAQVQRLLLRGFTPPETAEFVAAAGVASAEIAMAFHAQSERRIRCS